MESLKDILNRIENLEKMQKEITEQLSTVKVRQKTLDRYVAVLEKTKCKRGDYLKLKKEVSYIWGDIKRMDDKITGIQHRNLRDSAADEHSFTYVI